ncbi:MAG: hypothetical protein E6G67_05045 [Actinobacteria bacterium]|nr:MAG: hypothetical protein E6G67_05045 [Actinomycetota bacterium]
MVRTPSAATATAVQLAATLLVATAVSDALGHAGASFYLLVAGVPLTAAAGLFCFARVVDRVNGGEVDALGRFQAILSALLVATIVLGAAVRAPAVTDGRIPPPATAALALGFVLLVVQAVSALVPVRR